ncbi:sterile alpha motif domain-containing protein 11 isoform X1 [Pseudochaenichthys georgianus]|uniref:sterile alpha motif domain-containing protein 11 isoform X1 n=2 Tax=Pseudochaenichthys georgianus TaxID=52239 RepID=UPI001469AB57|nr:sterile alpha motif domain-containing protein 11 isoform X1 [Pseudochaenichthys georgianus]
MWEVGAARLAESAAAAASWKLLNGNLSGNFGRPLSHGDTEALRKTKRRVSKSGSAQLTDGEDAEVGSGEQLFTCYRRSAPTNMPAIKKERLDGDDMALTAFNQSEYLAPLNATAIPVVTPHPPPYDHIFAHHRAYLGLHDSALHHQHLHHHTDDLMLERFSSIPDFQPFFDNGEPCIEVECGENKALLYINKLCQGSKGPSIKYRGEWLTPNEFQFVSGRETAKDWKRSIRHKGKSLKTLMSKGILQVHPPICDCPGCRISSPVNRGRLAEKRTIPLPPNRVPKKELASIFSSDDSEGSERASGDHAHIKQEDELHYSIMRKSRDGDLSTIISNLHHTRQHGMPEGESASDHNTSTGHTDDLLSKRRSFSPNSSSECPSDSKKSRSVSPKENSQSPVVEAGSSHGHMSPEEHYRRMMSALSEQGSYEEQQQRLYQLASSMGLPGHGQSTGSVFVDMLRARQEALAAAVRNPSALEAHLPSAGSSSSSSQRRKQGLPQHRDAHYTDRELSHPPPLLSPPTGPHITLGHHLRPPFLGMPSALCQAPGYGFLQPAQAELFARQQEMLRKQNLARLEMSAELLRQKELESLHHRQQQHRLLGSDHLGVLPPGLPPDHPALRSLHDIPEGHPLREELARRSNAMLVLRHGASTPLLTLNHHHQHQQPGPPSTPKDSLAQRSTAGPEAESRKPPRRAPQTPLHAGDHAGGREDRGREGDREGQDEEMKDSDSETEMCEEREDSAGARSSSKPRDRETEGGRERGSKGVSAKDPAESSSRLSPPCSSAGTESPSRHLFTPGLGKADVKYHLPPGFMPPLPALHAQSLPFGFPYTNPYFHTGSVGGLFMDGEDSATANPVEDISKWSVEDVCGFISSLAGCAEYTQVFREQAIDGETLPLLTEEHLLTTMGLKLGPALKIRSQVARRVGRLFYMTGFPLAFPFPPSAALRPPERDRDPITTPSDTPLPLSLSLPCRPTSTSSSSSPYRGPTPGCSSPKQENGSVFMGRYEAKTPS